MEIAIKVDVRDFTRFSLHLPFLLHLFSPPFCLNILFNSYERERERARDPFNPYDNLSTTGGIKYISLSISPARRCRFFRGRIVICALPSCRPSFTHPPPRDAVGAQASRTFDPPLRPTNLPRSPVRAGMGSWPRETESRRQASSQ